ncbi:MAG: enoyl-CoA hydratase/isomerase family protein [Hyphomicrobiaceae bacterium]|nr:enoyl-CoA hydratase/isomerase family protein [Hyphomicrobiaceae bacterium]
MSVPETRSTAISTGLACGELAVARNGAAGCILLDRPRAMNAITSGMRQRLAAAMPGLARDTGIYALIIRSAVPGVFSAGGDLREIIGAARERPDEARRMLAEEYALNWLLECFSKPTVSLIDGLVMGSGVGLTIYGTHRVAGESYAFAMPETLIGLFPDDGLAWVFARMPAQIGLYLGLTGRRIGRAAAYRLGLVTHCIPAARFAEIEQALAAAEPVDALLDNLHEDPGPGEIEGCRDLVERSFTAASLEEVLARLAEELRRGGGAGAWCQEVLDEIAQRSPTALKVTFRHIREAAHRDLRQTLTIDYRLACRFLRTHDFHEGVRAMLIDKDRRPRWAPGHVAEVTDAMVDRFFAFQPGRELILPTRQEMQAARV